jgi:hypothetical protein
MQSNKTPMKEMIIVIAIGSYILMRAEGRNAQP